MQSQTQFVYANPNTGRYEPTYGEVLIHGNVLGHGYEHYPHHNGLYINYPTQMESTFIPNNHVAREERLVVRPPHDLDERQRREWKEFLPYALSVLHPELSQDEANQERMYFELSNPDDSGDQYSLPDTDIVRQPSPSASITTSTSTPTSTSTSTPKSPRPKKTRRTHTARNRQATAAQADLIKARLQLGRTARGELHDFNCPVTDCAYKQKNGRMPDLRRHMKTHLRSGKKICCKGIRFEEWMRYDSLCSYISEFGEPYHIPGEEGLWIGGCSNLFSRADALRRHLKKSCCLRV